MINKTIRFNLFAIKETQPTRNLISKQFYYIKIFFFLIYIWNRPVLKRYIQLRGSAPEGPDTEDMADFVCAGLQSAPHPDTATVLNPQAVLHLSVFCTF